MGTGLNDGEIRDPLEWWTPEMSCVLYVGCGGKAPEPVWEWDELQIEGGQVAGMGARSRDWLEWEPRDFL